jgi:hypothetical protein
VNWKGSVHGLIEVVSQYFPEETDENKDKLLSGYSVFKLSLLSGNYAE